MTNLTRSVLPGVLSLGLIVGVTSASASNTAGTLDTTFGTNGATVTNLASGIGTVNSVKLQSDGKILVLILPGSGPNQVLRYTAAGVLDTSFGSHGIAVLSSAVGLSMDLQANGQIVVAGVDSTSTGNSLAVERLNTNGSQDQSFGSGGLALASLANRAPLNALVMAQPNGDTLVCASLLPAGRRQPSQTELARFNAAGALDTTFGSQGITIATGSGGCTALALLANGNYLIVDGQFIAEFTANGSVESTVTGGTIVASVGSNESEAPSRTEIISWDLPSSLVKNLAGTKLPPRYFASPTPALRIPPSPTRSSTFRELGGLTSKP